MLVCRRRRLRHPSRLLLCRMADRASKQESIFVLLSLLSKSLGGIER